MAGCSSPPMTLAQLAKSSRGGDAIGVDDE
jgi:hypothetical protein